MSQKEKVFADGFLFKRRDTAPEWVIGNLSIKADEAIAFIKNNTKNGWVNLNINYSKAGTAYVELDTFEPKGNTQSKAEPAKVAEPEVDADLPF